MDKDRLVRARLPLLCVYVCIFICVTTACAKNAPVGEGRAVQLTLDLTDGSRIIGTPSVDRLKLVTGYASLEMPLAQVRTIDFAKEGDYPAQARLVSGDVLNTRLDAKELTLQTLLGKITIPISTVSKLRVASGSGAKSALPEGLVLRYSFDTDEDGKATDTSESGNGGNEGTVRGAEFTRAGKIGGAMAFSGNSEAVLAKNAASLQLQDMTIAAWIKRGDRGSVTTRPTGLGRDAMILGYGQGGWGFCIKSDGHIALSKVGIDHAFSSFDIHDTDFHHVAVTKKGDHIVFYLDGVAFPARDYNTTFTFNTIPAVGIRADTNTNCFLGTIDEVEVFNRPLSEEEVKGVFDSQK